MLWNGNANSPHLSSAYLAPAVTLGAFSVLTLNPHTGPRTLVLAQVMQLVHSVETRHLGSMLLKPTRYLKQEKLDPMLST